MNWKNLFFISTVFWVAVFFVSNCTQQGGDEMADSDFEEKIVICPPPPGADSSEIRKCAQIQGEIEGYKDFMAETNVAVSSIFDSLQASVPPVTPPPYTTVSGINIAWDSLQKEMGLLRGYKVDISDFRNIVKYANRAKRKNRSVNDVYVMFSINPKAKGREKDEIKYLDFYFQAVEKDEKGNTHLVNLSRSTSVTETSGFEDFPKPCPHSCPPGE